MYLSLKRKMFCPKLKKQDVELAEKAFSQLIKSWKMAIFLKIRKKIYDFFFITQKDKSLELKTKKFLI